jgi:hypothetical protein
MSQALRRTFVAAEADLMLCPSRCAASVRAVLHDHARPAAASAAELYTKAVSAVWQGSGVT